MLLAVGLLGLATNGLFVSSMLNRGRRVAAAAGFSTAQLERLRLRACEPARVMSGTDRLVRGGATVATTHWWLEDLGPAAVRIRLATRYVTSPQRTRTDTFETAVICAAP